MLRCFLFLFLTLSTSLLPSWAQNPQLQAGEIALEGTLESLDVVKNSLVLRATSFTGVSGASKPLPQPKSKAIQLDETTQFVESGGGKNLSLGDLEKGLKVRVLGRETAGKPFVARLIAWSAPATLQLDPLTPREKAPFLPAPQTQGNSTFRIIDAEFSRLKTVDAEEDNPRPYFHFTYRLRGPVAGRSEDGTPSRSGGQLQWLRLTAPDGRLLHPRMGSSIARDYAEAVTQEALENVDPQWPFIVAEAEVLDPQAPRDASGETFSDLTFEKVPLPAQAGQPLAMNREAKTPLGTKIVLQSVRFEAPKPGQPRGYTYFSLHVTPPAQVPDARLQISPQAVEEEGWPDHGSGGAFLNVAGQIETDISSAPPPGASRINLTFRVTERAPSLKKRKWYHQFRFQIPIAPLAAKFPPEKSAALSARLIAARGETANLEVEVERDQKRGSQWMNLLLWSQSKTETAPLDGSRRWILRDAKATSEGGEVFKVWKGAEEESHRFWHNDGRLAARGETSSLIQADFGDEKRPAKLNFELKFEAARRQAHHSRFAALPLPARGQKRLELREGQLEDDYLRVLRVVRFDDPKELPGLSGEKSQWFFKNGGVAVVVEIAPLFPGAEVDLTYAQIDETGRNESYGLESFKGDATQAEAPNSYRRTLFFAPPPPDVKSLDLFFDSVETAWSGQIERVTLRGVETK